MLELRVTVIVLISQGNWTVSKKEDTCERRGASDFSSDRRSDRKNIVLT
jgi:hypothetical protein